MNRNNVKKLNKRSNHVLIRNDTRFTNIHERLVKLNILNGLPAFTTKKYASEEYFNVFEQASLYNVSIKQMCIIGREHGKRWPSPEQVMKCCRKNTSTQMTNFINFALFQQFNAIPKPLRQQLKKSGIIFIDFHQDPYYGNKENPDVKRSKTKKSTTHFYEYLTASAYCPKGRVTIAIIHRNPDEGIFDPVKRILEFIERVLSPKIMVFDGEFSSVAILSLLNHKKIKFLARKSRTKRIKTHIASHYSMPDWKSFRKWHPIELKSWRSRIKTVYVDVCPQDVKGEMKTLIKSQGWVITPQYADKLYAKRFNIESGYRDKHKFQIFTCTKILSTRLVFILLATLLWNCWQIFLMWVKNLKSYSKFLPRTFAIRLSATWTILTLRTSFYS